MEVLIGDLAMGRQTSVFVEKGTGSSRERERSGRKYEIFF